MKSRFKKYLSSEDWLIRESGWGDSRKLGVTESIFTLGNGYLGSRGIYEEIPDGTEPGTYIAGIYDSAASMVPELVNAPNPIDFRIVVEGEKLDVGRMNVLENERTLDLKKGFILRRTVFSDTRGRRFLYESLRFFSMRDHHIGAMQVYFKSLDKPARIIVQDTVDDSVTNIGSLLEGRKRHTQLVDVSSAGDVNCLSVKTFTRKIWISYASFLAIQRGTGQGTGTLNKIFNMSVKKGETVCFTKIFSIRTSKHTSQAMLKKTAIEDVNRAKNVRFKHLLERHIERFGDLWESAEIKIEGDKAALKALRFNIYHLIISGKEKDDVSIGARTLSGNGYRGHVFWDTEIFILPFFIYSYPEIAKSLLMYRFNRLDRARKIAADMGYKGALFPWESADLGIDTTPPYAKDLDGSIIEIHTGSMEHHIVSDVAYGVSHYYEATGDKDFMLKCGLEMMLETARFWASRVAYNKRDKVYEINNVIGPDEFHEKVDNSVFTNEMARWNLLRAVELYEIFVRERPNRVAALAKKIRLKSGELDSWPKIAGNIIRLHVNSKGIIEEFDGYFKKRDIVPKKFNHFFMPTLPADISVKDVGKTTLVKQADVVMLLYLLQERFVHSEKKRNYLYYVKRTLHKSSLSPSIYSIMASNVGDRARAYLYFLFSLYADLKNTHGNTKEGIHAASLGGTWQAFVMGFAGFGIIDGMPSFEPRLPGHWRRVEFCLKWKGNDLNLKVSSNKIKIYISGKQKGHILIKAFDSICKVPFNKEYIIKGSRK